MTERKDQLVAELVRSGRYQNASEVLREGLRLIERREAEDVAKLVALREAAAVGIAALDRGDFIEFPDADALGEYLDAVADSIIRGE
ncbi:MAG: type II toxin-antitoxin system ParD family antitoxin [Chloroflexi bacterium]|nr:type II toxin-antitoxin system ParD family antitoxin [Chloroflexota bacterium]